MSRPGANRSEFLNWSFLLIAASQSSVLVANFLILGVLGNRLSTTDFGQYALGMSIVLFIRQCTFDPVSTVIGKDSALAAGRRVPLGSRFSTMAFICDRMAVFIFLGCSICMAVISVFFQASELILVGAFSCYLALNGAFGVYVNSLYSSRDRLLSSAAVGFDSAIRATAVLAVCGVAVLNLESVVLAVALSALLSFVVLRWSLRRRYQLPKTYKPKARSISGVFVQALPLLVPCMFTALKGVSDRWIFAAALGVDELAAYNVLYQLGFVPLVLAIGVVQTYVGPEVYQRCLDASVRPRTALMRYLCRLFSGIILLAAVAAVGSAAFSLEIVTFVVGDGYAAYSRYLPWFVIAGCLHAFLGILHVASLGLFDTKVVAKLSLFSVLIGCVVGVGGVVFGGFYGGVAGSILSGMAAGVIYWLTLRYK